MAQTLNISTLQKVLVYHSTVLSLAPGRQTKSFWPCTVSLAPSMLSSPALILNKYPQISHTVILCTRPPTSAGTHLFLTLPACRPWFLAKL